MLEHFIGLDKRLSNAKKKNVLTDKLCGIYKATKTCSQAKPQSRSFAGHQIPLHRHDNRRLWMLTNFGGIDPWRNFGLDSLYARSTVWRS